MTTTVETNALSHNPEVFKRTFWLHMNPNENNGFGEIWKTRTEPIYSKTKHGYTFTRDGILDDDRMVHLNVNTRAVLPKELHKLVTPGKKVKVNVECTYEIKDIDDPCDEISNRIIYTENVNEPFKILRCNDHMLFGPDVNVDIHERIGVIYTAQEDNSITIEYINEYGKIIPEASGSYTIFGKVGDDIIPKTIGDYYCDALTSEQNLEYLLSKAYKQGVRFEEPPKDDVIHLSLCLEEDGILNISCDSDYYGFGNCLNLNFSCINEYGRYNGKTLKDIQKDEDFIMSCHIIDRALTQALIAYRWFFNRPNLRFEYDVDIASYELNEDVKSIINKYLVDRVEYYWNRKCSRGSSFKPTKNV